MTRITATRYSRATASASAPRSSRGTAEPHLAGTVWKAAVLVVLAVALIVGILAMHSFASTASHSEMGMPTESSTAAVGSPHDTAGVFAASSPDCVGCGEDASMTIMWCVLALLTATLLLVASKLAKGWVGVAWRHLLTARPILTVVGFVPLPPSLTVLCISRT